MSSDSKIQAIVKQIRENVNQPTQPTFTLRQAKSVKRRPPQASEWSIRTVIPAPKEDGVRTILLDAIKELGDAGEDFEIPSIESVEAEWVGHRKDSGADRRVQVSEHGAYKMLERDCSTQVTLLYLHGGGYFQGSPDESRSTASTLARLTGGICLSVAYRLSPQHPFPAAILDTLIVYLSILHPPPGSHHAPVPASSIVLTGDSAGATLAFATIQVILQLRNRSGIPDPKINFHNNRVSLPLPAGLAALSAYGDLTHSMPSWLANLERDYLPSVNPTLWPTFPACAIWPTKPPRVNALCNDTVLHHPLVSPVAVKDWSGFPPLWLGYGEEMMADEGKFIAQQASRQGVPVVWEEWGGMPHCFPILPPLSRLPQSRQAFQKWAAFCTACVENPMSIRTRGRFNLGAERGETSVDVKNLLELRFEEVKRRMQKARMEVVKSLEGRERARSRL